MLPATSSRRPHNTLQVLVCFIHLVLLTLLQGEELVPFTSTRIFYAIIYYDWDFPQIVDIRSRIEVMRVPRLGDR